MRGMVLPPPPVPASCLEETLKTGTFTNPGLVGRPGTLPCSPALQDTWDLSGMANVCVWGGGCGEELQEAGFTVLH